MQAKVEQILLPVNLKLYNLVKIFKKFNTDILLEFKHGLGIEDNIHTNRGSSTLKRCFILFLGFCEHILK